MTDQHLEGRTARVETGLGRAEPSPSLVGMQEPGGVWDHPERRVAEALKGIRAVGRFRRAIETLPLAYLCGQLERQVRLWPALPAATMWSDHFGMHGHKHLPFLVTPAVPPALFPSLGPVMLGCSPNVLIGGKRAARQGDMGFSFTCGGFMPLFTIETGSSTVLIGGARAARMGDLVQPCKPLKSSSGGGRDPLGALLALKLGPLVALHARFEFWWGLFAPLADAASRLLAPTVTAAELAKEHAPEEVRALEARLAFEQRMVEALAPEVVVTLALRYLPLVQGTAFQATFPGAVAAARSITILGTELGKRGVAGLTRVLASAPQLREVLGGVANRLVALLPASLPSLNAVMTDAPVISTPHILVPLPSAVNVGGMPLPSTDTLLRAFRGVANRLLSLRLPKAQAQLSQRLIPLGGGLPYVL